MTATLLANPDLLGQTSIDVDGLFDDKHDIKYIGRATRDEAGQWSCLAIVAGCLCRVAITITPPNVGPPTDVLVAPGPEYEPYEDDPEYVGWGARGQERDDLRIVEDGHREVARKVMTVGDLRRALEGVPDDLYIVVRGMDEDGDDFIGELQSAGPQRSHSEGEELYFALDAASNVEEDA